MDREAIQVKACCTSEYAAEKLGSLEAGLIGHVRSVHSGLFNFVLADGDLLAVQSFDRVRTPLSIVIGRQWNPRLEMTAGEPVFLQRAQGVLQCGRLAVHFSGALDFGSNAAAAPRDSVHEPLAILMRHLNENRKIRSVYQFVRPDGKIRIENETERHYSVLLRQSAGRLLLGLQQGDVGEIVNSALKMIGLGPGMTPGGDDYLQGFFLFAQSFGRNGELIREAGEAINARMDWDTTELSRTLWKHFWQGRVAEPVVRMVEYFNAGDWYEFEHQVKALSQLGHSSGDDYLSGVWQALHFLHNQNKSGAGVENAE